VGTEEADFLLHDEALHFSKIINSGLDEAQVVREYRAWVGKIGAVDVFIWETDVTYNQPSPPVSGVHLDPGTGMQQTIARHVERIYIDLVTGLQLKTETDLYLVNGNMIDGSHGIITGYEYWPVLPEQLAEVYDKMAADVRQALEK
jgi:hypothetical protein